MAACVLSLGMLAGCGSTSSNSTSNTTSKTDSTVKATQSSTTSGSSISADTKVADTTTEASGSKTLVSILFSNRKYKKCSAGNS